MVAPAATELEATRGVAFLDEPTGLDETDGSDIAGLDVGLKAMQLEPGESVTNHRAQAR